MFQTVEICYSFNLVCPMHSCVVVCLAQELVLLCLVCCKYCHYGDLCGTVPYRSA
jgi:hypothetical protein